MTPISSSLPLYIRRLRKEGSDSSTPMLMDVAGSVALHNECDQEMWAAAELQPRTIAWLTNEATALDQSIYKELCGFKVQNRDHVHVNKPHLNYCNNSPISELN